MSEQKKLPVTMTWDASLLEFVRKPLFKKIHIKITQLSELAMEEWLKANGHWDEYQAFKNADDLM